MTMRHTRLKLLALAFLSIGSCDELCIILYQYHEDNRVPTSKVLASLYFVLIFLSRLTGPSGRQADITNFSSGWVSIDYSPFPKTSHPDIRSSDEKQLPSCLNSFTLSNSSFSGIMLIKSSNGILYFEDAKCIPDIDIILFGRPRKTSYIFGFSFGSPKLFAYSD